MIRVQRIAPTASYEQEVKIPGAAFLATNPAPSRDEFNRNDFWKEIHQEMYNAYNGICMYCASWTPRTRTGAVLQQTSIDHFIPKSIFPQMAYDWENFRLSRDDINTNKSIEQYIPDPFGIKNKWFTIDFATWFILASDDAPIWIRNRIKMATVKLGLNDDAYISERQQVAALYVHYPNDRAELASLYPFLVAEIERQSQGSTLIVDLRNILPRPA